MPDDLVTTPLSKNIDTRLWKTLDNISERLAGIELKLSDIVRLEERMNNHDGALARYGSKLDNHDNIIHEVQLWQAGHRGNGDFEKEIDSMKSDMVILKETGNIGKGQKDVVKEILKITVAVLVAVVIYKFTRG